MYSLFSLYRIIHKFPYQKDHIGFYTQQENLFDLILAFPTENNVSMKESDFADMYMVNTKFLGVNLSNSRFGCSIMNNVEFKNPDLKNSQFIHCDLTNVEINDCKIDGLKINGVDIQKLLEQHEKEI